MYYFITDFAYGNREIGAMTSRSEIRTGIMVGVRPGPGESDVVAPPVVVRAGAGGVVSNIKSLRARVWRSPLWWGIGQSATKRLRELKGVYSAQRTGN